jgi:3-oxoacyl-[acyl-carrier-protein] synthase II
MEENLRGTALPGSSRDASDDIVITGIGIVSPVGASAHSTMRALLKGESGVTLLPESQRALSPVHLHATVDDAALTDVTRVERRRLDRSAQLALQAAREAWRDAGEPDVEPARLASVVSSGMGGLQTIFAGYEYYATKGYVGLPAYIVPALMSNSSSAVIACEYGAHAAAVSLASACASGADALAYALRLFLADEIDVAIIGGTEAVVHPITLSAFATLRALSTRSDDPAAASRPFDRDRDGFVLGEGAAVLVAERRRHAIARRARIWGRLLGAGSSCDAAHVVAPEPTGRWSAEAMRKALRSAGVVPADVAFVSAHATATQQGDVAEARALHGAFGNAISDIGVTALKSAIGHLIGAAGPVAVAVALMSLHQGIIPATQNLDNLDPEIELDVVHGAPRPLARDGVVLVNSSGFGGHNVAVVVAKD